MNTLTNTRQTKMNLDALNKIDELNKLDTLFDIETNNVMDFINTKLSSNSIKFLQLVKNRINESIKQQRVVIKNEKMELKQMKLEDKKNKVVKEKKPRVVKEKKEKVVKEKKEKVVKQKKEKVVKQKKEKVVLETVEIEPENIKFEICELDEDELAEEELLTQLHYSKQDMENEQPTNEEYEIEEYKEEEEEPEEIKSEEQVKQELIDDIFGDDDEDNHFYCYECKIDYLEYEKLECADGNCCIDCGIKNRCVCYVCDYKGLLKTNLFQEQTINTVLNPPITNVIIKDEPIIYGSLNDPTFEIIEEIKPLEDTYISDDTAVQDYFKSIKSGDIVDLLSNSDIVKCKFIQLRKFRVEILVINWEDADGNIKENNLNKKLIVGLAPITIIIKHKPVEIKKMNTPTIKTNSLFIELFECVRNRNNYKIMFSVVIIDIKYMRKRNYGENGGHYGLCYGEHIPLKYTGNIYSYYYISPNSEYLKTENNKNLYSHHNGENLHSKTKTSKYSIKKRYCFLTLDYAGSIIPKHSILRLKNWNKTTKTPTNKGLKAIKHIYSKSDYETDSYWNFDNYITVDYLNDLCRKNGYDFNKKAKHKMINGKEKLVIKYDKVEYGTLAEWYLKL